MNVDQELCVPVALMTPIFKDGDMTDSIHGL